MLAEGSKVRKLQAFGVLTAYLLKLVNFFTLWTFTPNVEKMKMLFKICRLLSDPLWRQHCLRCLDSPDWLTRVWKRWKGQNKVDCGGRWWVMVRDSRLWWEMVDYGRPLPWRLSISVRRPFTLFLRKYSEHSWYVQILRSEAGYSLKVCLRCSLMLLFFSIVREKKDLPLGPVDQKDQDGSFDYQ